MKYIPLIVTLFLSILACNKQDNNSDNQTNSDVKQSILDKKGNILVASKTIIKEAENIIFNKIGKKVNFEITGIKTDFNGESFNSVISFITENNIRSNFMITNSSEIVNKLYGENKLLERAPCPHTIISCEGSCDCGLAGSATSLHCSCGPTTGSPSGPACSMRIKCLQE